VGHADNDELLVAIFELLSGLLRAGRFLSGTWKSRYYFNQALGKHSEDSEDSEDGISASISAFKMQASCSANFACASGLMDLSQVNTPQRKRTS
jgi:hypothetical protein